MRNLLTLLAILMSAPAFAQGTLTTLYSFRGTPFNSWQPYAAVTVGPDGAFYGVTRAGGPSFFGTVYRLTRAGEHRILYSFGGPDGSQPRGRLVLAPDGNFYGTTYVGGANNAGTIFRITPAGALTTLHHFGGAVGGGNPVGGLLLSSDGTFYGTTSGDNFGTGGTIFRITPAGAFTTLKSVPGRPHGALIQDASGNLYGTSISSGAFRLSVLGVLTTFPAETAVGEGVLTFGPDGALYGTTIGSVFRLDPLLGTATTLYRFSGGVDGQQPLAGLTLARDGLLYGTTIFGGTLLHGTLFRISPAGQFESLHSFGTADFDGWIPRSELVELEDGTLVGTASEGGQFASGTVYTYTPDDRVDGKLLGDPCVRPGGCTAGNPIDIATGNKFEQVTDYETAGPNVLGFTRYYNSQALAGPTVFAGRLGIGWRHSFERFVHIESASSVFVERADGRALKFSLSGATWQSDSDVDLHLAQPDATTWVLTDGNDTLEVYRTIAADRAVLTALRARNGYVQGLSYDGSGALRSVADSFGRTMQFTYASNLLQTVTTPDGLVVSFGYDTVGILPRLTTVSYSTAPATSVSYLYERGHFPFALTGLINENGDRYATWEYDNDGRAFASEHAGGTDRTTIDYDDDDTRTVTNALGLKLVHRFTTLQGVPKLTQVDRLATASIPPATRTFTFDGNGYLASQSDWNGNRTIYTNDARGLPTRMVEPAGRITTYSYDATLHLPTQMVQPGMTTDFTYDADGNLLTRTETDTTLTALPYATAGAKRTWTLTWAGGLLASTQGPRTDVAAITRFDYDASGALIQTTNALGQTLKVTSHTPGGRPLIIVDANDVTTDLTYDARQRITSSTVRTSAGNRTTGFTYDRAGNAITTTLPDGSSLTNSYDAAMRLNGITDLFNQATAHTLDVMGNRTRTAVQDAGGNVTRSQGGTYDALGHMLSSVGGVGQTNRYSYDSNGNRVTEIDPLGRATQNSYDALNRLIRSVDPAGGVTLFTYDLLDRLLVVIAPNGTTTTYVYDGFGRRIQVLSPDSGKTVYRYDLAGNVTQTVDARGVVTNSSYDALDRITARTFPATAAENVAYRYDEPRHGAGIGRLTSLTDAVGTLNRSYDERGNVLREDRSRAAVTLTTSYAYDPANRVLSLTYPSGGRADYARDAMGRVTGLTYAPKGAAAQIVAANISYRPFGPVSGLTFGNGVVESRTFDTDYRVTDIVGTGLAPIQSFTYVYDAANNVRGIADGIAAANSQTFGYDALDRLTAATGGYGNQSYTYDPNGNRLAQSVNNVVTTYAYGAGSNRLTQVRTAAALQALAYTPDGNTTSVADFPKTRPTMGIAYNQAGQLARVLADAKVTMQNTYDAFGQRLFRTGTATGTTFFQYDVDGHLLEDADGLGRGRVDYLYLGARPIGNFQLGFNRLTFLHVDHLGTTKAGTDAAQAIVWRGDAEPFGATSVSIGLASQNLRLPGQEYELDTGWHHNGFRDYVPALGRYLQSDPAGLSGGLDRYSYVNGKPTQMVDRLGLQSARGVAPSRPPRLVENRQNAELLEKLGDFFEGAVYLHDLMDRVREQASRELEGQDYLIDLSDLPAPIRNYLEKRIDEQLQEQWANAPKVCTVDDPTGRYWPRGPAILRNAPKKIIRLEWRVSP